MLCHSPIAKIARGVAYLCTTAVAASSTPISAATIVRDKSHGGEDIIIILGKIEKEDDVKFKKIASELDSATVILSSDGGYFLPAIEIGKAIRLKGYSTIAMRDNPCNSSCALIWLAGTPRRMHYGAKVGFHSIYTKTGDRAEASAVGNAIVGRYLTILNLSEQAVIFATVSPPNQFNWLTTDNYRKIGIDLSPEVPRSAVDEGVKRSAGSANAEITDWDKIGSWRVAIDNTMGPSCFALAQWDGGTVLRIGFSQASSTAGYLLFGHDNWKSLIEGQEYKLTAQFGNYGQWSLPSIAVKMKSTIFLKANFENDEFWKEFAKSKTFRLSYEGREVAHLDLLDSAKALSSMIDCQRHAISSGNNNDPFSN